jgi:amino acid adenylation domain-containing protein
MEKEVFVFPTSFGQQRLWFLDQLAPGGSTYNIAQVFSLSGPLQQTALERSLNEIVRRHETLRTTFVEIEGEPAQIIGPPWDEPLKVISLWQLPAGDRETEAGRLIEEEARRPFDLAKGPLFCATLLRIDKEEHILLLTMHHIVSDGWSMGVLYRELSVLYEAFCQHKVPSLPELPIQYADYAVWQREYLQGEVLEAELRYWRKQLAGMPPPLTFPAAPDRSSAPARQGARQSFSLSKSLSDALKALSRREEATLFMTLLAAFYLWLHRATGRDDLVVGSPVAGRNRRELEGLIGFFVNTLPLRADLSGDVTFRELLSQVRRVSVETLTHQDAPIEKLVEILHPKRTTLHNPLIQVAFVFQAASGEELRLPGLTAKRMNIHAADAKLELTLFMWEGADELQGAFVYDTGLFSDSAVTGMIGHFQRLLEAIVADPQRRLSEMAPVIGQTVKPRKTLEKGDTDIDERSNLTKNQLLVWLGQKLQPETPLYNTAVAFTLSGAIDRDHFQRAFQKLVNSSDALRTVIEESDGIPRQKVLETLPHEIEYLDFSASSDPQAASEKWLQERSRVLFKFDERLFDSALIKIAEQRFVWYLNQHHIITDGWSLWLIYHHMSEVYGHSLDGRLDGIAALPRFQDYVHYEREERASARHREAEAYWQKKLAEKPEPLNIYGASRATRPAAVRRMSLDLGVERTQKLKALAARREICGVTEHAAMFNIFAATLFTYLYRVTGNGRQSIGVPFHNRRLAAFKNTPGLIMEVLPLRITTEQNDTFLSVIQKIRAEMSEIRPEIALPNPPYDKIYDVVMNYHTTTYAAFHGMPVRVARIHTGHENDALAVQARDFDGAGSLGLDFDFRCDVFDEEQRRQAMRHFVRLLDGLVENPAGSLHGVNLLTPEEQHRVLVEWNDTKRDYPKDKCIHELFEEQAERSPDAVAVHSEDQQLTYRELNRRANQLAHYLKKRAVGPEARVGIYMERSVEMVVGLLGILKAGGAYLPLDPAYPKERLAFMLEDADAKVLLTQHRFVEGLPSNKAQVVCLDTDWRLIAREPEEHPVRAAAPDNLVYVIYTSGSTGQPKGVQIAHKSLVNYIHVLCDTFRLEPGDRGLQFSSISFDSSAEEIFHPLAQGATLVLRTDEMLSSPRVFLEQCREWGVTMLPLSTAYWHEIAAALSAREAVLPDQARFVNVGGERIVPQRMIEWRKSVGEGVRLINGYGPTETTVVATMYDAGRMDRAELWSREVPIGRPIANVQAYLLDKYRMPVPIGIPGELHIGGAGLARGYLNSPELTAEKFIPNPFSDEPGARLYKTGDLARYLPDGNIEFLGRIDYQVKIRGFRIEPGEIEGALNQHPGLRDCVVVAWEKAGGEKQMVAYITYGAGDEPTVSDLRRHLRTTLPEYMIPSIFVPLDALPLTPNGKVDRRALPDPEGLAAPASEDYVAPRTPMEEEIAGVWRELLGVERVGVYDNFFDLGGHSLLSMKVIFRIEKLTGHRIRPAEIIYQTLEQLAAAGERQSAAGRPARPKRLAQRLLEAIHRGVLRFS